jgi:putative Holliday junction resolvase
MPYAPDGGRGKKGEEVDRFVAELRGAVSVPVETWDESFTSVNAQRAFIAGGMKRKQRQQKGRVDEMAARLLLEDYLESGDHH